MPRSGEKMILYKEHGRPRGGQNGHLPPLEIEIKGQKFLEILKSAA